MAKRGALLITSLVVIVGFCAGVEAFVFSDPTGFYSTTISDQWVYQAHQSTSLLTVFYGEGDYDLLYFERLGTVLDASSRELAERSLELYGAPGGLEGFRLESALSEVDFAGEDGVLCAYSYKDGHGNRLVEFRVFIVLPVNEGFSVAISGTGDTVSEPPLLQDILSHWRWLF
ncbi:MAG: hypothetical protein GX971_12015 [Firmicutes bacterium]|nr:hypothetical protein [Bacillota bacterium]